MKVASTFRLALASGAVALGRPFRAPALTTRYQLCALSGSLRAARGPLLATLPPRCRPSGSLRFTVWASDSQGEVVQVLPSGEVRWAAFDPARTLSLDGVAFLNAGGAANWEVRRVSDARKAEAAAEEAREAALAVLAAPQQVSLLNNNSYFGYGTKNPQVSKFGGICVLSGMVAADDITKDLIRTPPSCRPASRLQFLSHTEGAAPTRLDVLQDGTVRWAGGASSGKWVSLDGLAFYHKDASADNVRPLLLDANFKGFGDAFGDTPSAAREGDVCVVNGLLKVRDAAKWVPGAVLATLPPDCRPTDGKMVFTVAHNALPHRVDVFTDGRVVFAGGDVVDGFVSLSGLVIGTVATAAVRPAAGWRAYGMEFRAPQVTRSGQLCVASGVLRVEEGSSGSGAAAPANSAVATLPAGCRPTGRLVFAVNRGARRQERVDVLETGEVRWVPAAGEPLADAWLPLDGVFFMAVAEADWEAASETTWNKNYEVQQEQERAAAAAAAEEKARKDKAAAEAAAKAQAEQEARAKAEAERAAAEAQAEKERLEAAAEDKAKSGHALPLADGVEPMGGDYAVPQVIDVGGKVCLVMGVGFSTDIRRTVATLPKDCWPAQRLVLLSQAERATDVRYDVFPNGEIQYQSGTSDAKGGAVHFGGMMVIAADADIRDVVLVTPRFSNIGAPYMDATYVKTGDYCVLQGLVRVQDYNSKIGSLDRECQPQDGQLIFSAGNGLGNHHRVDVTAAGDLVFQSWGEGRNGGFSQMISLNGIQFFAGGSPQPLSLAQGWSPYANGYRRPSFQKQGQLCALSGLLAGSGFGQVAVVSPECRPSMRVSFIANMHQYEQRVDIMDDGRVVWVDGNLAHGWLSLDGIVWAPNTYKIKTAAPVTKAFTTGSVPFLPGWKPVGDLYRDPQYARWNSVCMLSGLVANADNLKAPIARLPEDCRPGDGTHIFNSHSSASNTLRVDVGPSGKVFWNGGDQVSDFIGLDGIIFTVSGTRRIDLHLNQALYRNFENDYAAASYSLEGDLCVVQGLVRDVNQRNMQGGLIGYLPPDCRPQDGRLIFSLNHNQFTHRVDVLEDGTVYYITGSSVNTWISLDGVAFTTSASQQVLAGLNGWQPYQNSYRAPSYKLVADGAVCVLSGLWSAGSGWTVTVLPTSCRPSKRLTFWVNHHTYNTRLDILPDGRVMFKAGWLVHGWVPFDGIRFTADQGPDPAPSASKVVRATNATALQLSAGITNFGQGYEPATYQRLGDLCVVQGMLATGDQMMQVLATLPADCRPAASLIFAAQTADSNQARVDVTPAGEVRWVAGSSSGGWLSLSGIQFVVAGAGVPLPLRLDWQWVALGRGYKEPEFQLVGSLCIVSGVVRTDNMLTNIVNSEVARLPSDCTPRDGRLIFRVNQNQFTRRLDAVQDGRLVVSDGASWSHPWMSLEGVRFVGTEGGAQPLDLASGWDHYYNDYRKGSWHKEGNLCIFSGLINSGSRPALIVTLSSECRPAARQVFWVDQDTAAARVDVLPDGRMLYSGPAYRSWVPLDGISFTTAQFVPVADPDSRASNTKEGTQIELQDGFRNFNDGFRNAVWTRVGALCVLSGRVVANDIRGRIGTLPPKCRPARALQFNTFNGQWDAHPFAVQVNVMADGQVRWGASFAWDQSSGNFISLDGISFAVADATRAPVPNSAMQNFYMNPSSGEFSGVEFAVVGDACHVQGNVVVEKMNQIPGGNVLVLPASCRPADGRLILNAGQGSVFNRLDLETTGQMSLQAGETRFKFLSLSNVFFFRAAGTPLEMRSGWGTYGSGYRRPSFRRMDDSNLCIVSGLASGSAIGTMAVLPESCRPMERLQFSVNNHNFAGRIDVLPDGRLINVFQNRHSWISLDGISFVVPLDRQASAYPLVDAASMKSGGNLTLLSGFAVYQRGYADPALFEFGSLCMLQGMLRTPDNDVSHVVLQLPAGSRCVPKGRIPFDRHTKADQTVRADLMADGQLRYVAGPGESDMFPLDGIVWPASDAPQGSLELAGRWVAMGRGYQEPGWIRQGSMCLLTGTIRTESDRLQDMTDLLANLPGDCRPADGRIILDANQQDDSFRVDALPDGQLVLAQPGARGKRFPFISLGGIAFFDKVKTMTLSSGYSPYNNGYRVPGFAAEGDLCALSGLAYAGSQRTMAMLPRECRPHARVWFNVYIGSSTRRVDVLPSGEVLWVSGSSSGWVSFDGIFFRRVPVTDSL